MPVHSGELHLGLTALRDMHPRLAQMTAAKKAVTPMTLYTLYIKLEKKIRKLLTSLTSNVPLFEYEMIHPILNKISDFKIIHYHLIHFRMSMILVKSSNSDKLSNRVVHVSVQLFSNEDLAMQMTQGRN